MRNLWVDKRIGGIIRYHFLNEGEQLMRLPDEVRECVIFVGCAMLGEDKPYIGATAFLLSTPFKAGGLREQRHKYAITANHTLVEIDRLADEGLVVDNNVWLRIDLIDSESRWIPTDREQWISHPETDLAILPLSPVEVHENLIGVNDVLLNRTIYSESIADEYKVIDQKIGVGDEVVAVGLFSHHKGQGKNLPMVRSGIIAGMPEEKVSTEDYGDIDAYLVELRSIGGFSGSPVFVYLGGPPFPIPTSNQSARVYERMTQFDDRTFYLLGLLHGHWDIQESQVGFDRRANLAEGIGTGMAIVVPATKISELLEDEKLKEIE